MSLWNKLVYALHAGIATALLLVAVSPVFGQTKVEAYEVELRDFDQQISVPATIDALHTTGMMSRLEGYVGEVHVDIGDRVRKDDVLLELDAPEIAAEVNRQEKLLAKAEAEANAVGSELARVNAREAAIVARKSLRESELQRMQKLVKSGVMTQTKLDEAQFAYESVLSDWESIQADGQAAEARFVAAKAGIDVADADLLHAKLMARYLRVVAPYDALVTHRHVDPGAYVKPPSGPQVMPLLTLESVDKVRVVMMVPYASADGLDIGDKVSLAEVRGTKAEFAGTLTRLGARFEQGSRMLRVEMELENPVDTRSGKRPLRSGDYGVAVIRLHSLPQTKVVPATAVTRSSTETYVTQIVDGKAARRSVQVLASHRGWTAISGPIKAGDFVIVDGVDDVKDDQTVTIK